MRRVTDVWVGLGGRVVGGEGGWIVGRAGGFCVSIISPGSQKYLKQSTVTKILVQVVVYF